MILAVDTFYYEEKAKTVGIVFKDWKSDKPLDIIVSYYNNPLEYESGNFFKRELPCIMKLLEDVDLSQLSAIIVDGYVYLDDDQKGGLGYYLYNMLGEKIPVIGVAKTEFKNNHKHVALAFRGKSMKPLFVTAIGAELESSRKNVEEMHGCYRIPSLLKTLDIQTKNDI